MPRSASDRKFGFKAKGLIRILLAADIDEVRKALDELSFAPPVSGVGPAIKKLLKAPFGLLEALLDLIFEDVVPLTENIRDQIRVLDDVVEVLDSMVRAQPPPFAPFPGGISQNALPKLRKMRRSMAAQIVRQQTTADELEAIKNRAKTLEETQETSLAEILDIDSVA